MLYKDDNISRASWAAFKNKQRSSAILKKLDENRTEISGKTEFSQVLWGQKTNSYLLSAKKLKDEKFDKIIASARAYANPGRGGDSLSADEHSPQDDRALLVDDSN
jgi:hypothetical protein